MQFAHKKAYPRGDMRKMHTGLLQTLIVSTKGRYAKNAYGMHFGHKKA